jgi:hypothetical protein
MSARISVPCRRALDRRTVLRGLLGGSAVAVGLPALEIMLNGRGDALATGAPLPDRFGVWFWGNGCRPDYWTPSGSAPWTPSAELAPLADLVAQVSVVTGCEMKTSDYPHHGGMTGIMTGQHYQQLGTTRDTIVSTFARQSVDQDAADWFDGQTAFRSLEVGITTFRGTDEGSTFQHLSHNGPNNPNPSEYSPSALYRRLFTLPADPGRALARQSVHDVVSSQAERLKQRRGARDVERVEQHLDSIRTLETRIAAGASACAPGAEPVDVPDVYGLEQIAEKNQVMSDLLALALACDLTRSFSVQFSTCGSGVIFWDVGATDSLHLLCHTEALPQPIVHAATVVTMEHLAVFLRALRDTPEGSGNLLERSSILCTTELTDGWDHGIQEFPILVAGLGNGRLKGGIHYRSTNARNTSDAVLTALHGAGVSLASWGVDAGYTASPITELLV